MWVLRRFRSVPSLQKAGIFWGGASLYKLRLAPRLIVGFGMVLFSQKHSYRSLLSGLAPGKQIKEEAEQRCAEADILPCARWIGHELVVVKLEQWWRWKGNHRWWDWKGYRHRVVRAAFTNKKRRRSLLLGCFLQSDNVKKGPTWWKGSPARCRLCEGSLDADSCAASKPPVKEA